MALFANVTGDSRQWMAAQLAALPRIGIDLLIIALIHVTDIVKPILFVLLHA
jgi:hypothetical protein